MKKQAQKINDLLFETYDLMDTKVTCGGVTLCWISWSDREKFAMDYANLLSKYRV